VWTPVQATTTAARSSADIMRTMLWTAVVEEAQGSAVDPIARWLAVGSFLATVMFGVLAYLRDRARVSVGIRGHGPLRRGWILQAHAGVTEHIEVVNSGRIAVEVRRGYWRVKGNWQQRSSSTRNVPTDDVLGHRAEDPLPVTVPGLSTRAGSAILRDGTRQRRAAELIECATKSYWGTDDDVVRGGS
jgi:hypothetical protein